MLKRLWLALAVALPCVSAHAQQATQIPPAKSCFSGSVGQNGVIGALGSWTAGGGGTDGTYTANLLGGSGNGATATIVVTTGVIASQTLVNAGQGYAIGDVLTASPSAIGGVLGYSTTVASTALSGALAGGSVAFYVPDTTTPKSTWQDANQVTLNPNPVPLDGNGCALIYGAGSYREVLKDAIGNTVWDQPTTTGGFYPPTIAQGLIGNPNTSAGQAGFVGIDATLRFVNGLLGVTPSTANLHIVSVADYGASGSSQTTTGSITSGSSALNVASPIDFAVGQGVRVIGAGATFFADAVSGISSSVVGTAGTTSYTYYIASIDYAGGMGPYVSYTVNNGPDVITYTPVTGGPTYDYYGSTQSYVQLTLTQGSGSSGYVIYRGIAGATPTLYAVSLGSTFKDQGIGWGSAGASGVISWDGPNYFPTAAPTVALNDWLVTTITAISGNTLTLSANASNSPISAAVYHDETAAFNAAASANSTHGANIQIPCGNDNLSSSIAISADNIGFSGNGSCTNLQTFGTSSVFSLINASSTLQRSNFVNNLNIAAFNQTAGSIIKGTNLYNFGLNNVYVDHPPYGYTFINPNTINATNDYILSGPRGTGSIGFLMASDSLNAACCLNAYNFYIHGNGQYVGGPSSIGGQDKAGFEFDGNVGTVYGFGMADSDIEGDGFLILNDTGNPSPPTYLTFYSASAEFPTSRDVNIFGPTGAAGPSDVYFSDSTITGAQNGNSNVVIDNLSARIKFMGGKSSNAGCRGFDIAGTQVTITGGMQIGNNSTTSAGGTSGSCDGIVLEASSRGTVITGNPIGDPFNPTVQNHPISIVNGADYYTITGNTFSGNVTNCVANGGSTSVSRVVGSNAGSC